MKNNYRTALRVVATLACFVGASAQSPAPDSKDANLLAPEYRDSIHDLRICLPDGVTLSQKDGGQLISFVHPTRLWGGEVRFDVLEQNMSVEKYLQSNADAMNKNFKGLNIETSKVIKVGDKDAGLQISEFNLTQEVTRGHPEQVTYYKQDLMLQMATNQYVHLSLFAPIRDKDLATRTFNAMIPTFHVANLVDFQKQRLKQTVDGSNWLAKLNADALAPKLITQPQIFRVMVRDKQGQDQEVGFVRFDESEETQDGLKGVCVKVQSFTFQADADTILTSSTHAWWPYENDAGKPVMEAVGLSKWEAVVRSFPPAGASADKWVWQQEKGVTKFDAPPPGAPNGVVGSLKLIVKTDTGMDKEMDPSRAIPTEKGWDFDFPRPFPLPKVLEFTWQRMVDLTKPGALSFPVYNSGAKKMGLRTLSVIGPETVMIDGVQTQAIHLTDDLENGSTSLWVDKSGRTLMMKTNDGATLVPTTKQLMDARYGAKMQRTAGKTGG